VEKFLNGPLAQLPLTALCDVPEESLSGLVDTMGRRISSETSALNTDLLWTEFDLLLGFKYPSDFVQSLLKGVGNMQESSTYRAIFEQGEASGQAQGITIGETRGIAIGETRGIAIGETRGEVRAKRESILRIGAKRFDEPDATVRALLDQIDSVERLNGLEDRLIEAESWSDLLGN
jgi:hypothetical protein